jgi:hypothetical protein
MTIRTINATPRARAFPGLSRRSWRGQCRPSPRQARAVEVGGADGAAIKITPSDRRGARPTAKIEQKNHGYQRDGP